MSSKIVESLGRCLTSYKSKDFDEIISKSISFKIYSQYETYPLNIPIEVSVPFCGANQTLYGVDSEGVEHFLKQIVDSSD